MEFEIKRINAWSVLKIVFIFYLCFGSILGIIFAFISNLLTAMVMGFSSSYFGDDVLTTSALSIFVNIISVAIFFAVSGSIITLVFVGIYNLLSNLLGGIKLELANSPNNTVLPREDNKEYSKEEPVNE